MLPGDAGEASAVADSDCRCSDMCMLRYFSLAKSRWHSEHVKVLVGVVDEAGITSTTSLQPDLDAAAESQPATCSIENNRKTSNHIQLALLSFSQFLPAVVFHKPNDSVVYDQKVTF